MKKLFLLVAIAIFSLSYAQESASSGSKGGDTGGLSFGPKVGVNLSTLVGDVEDVKTKVGVYFGGFANIPVSEKLAFQPEILYSVQGAKEEYTNTTNFFGITSSTEYKVNTKLNYINIPLMLQWYPSGGGAGFFAEVGPQIGFIVTKKQETKVVTNSEEKITEADLSGEAINGFDFGFNVGLGYELPMGLSFNARYNGGFSNINKEGDNKIRNSVISIGAGYSF